MKIKDLIPNYKLLKEYSISELIEFLEDNENVPANAVACICSEILRRQIKSGTHLGHPDYLNAPNLSPDVMQKDNS